MAEGYSVFRNLEARLQKKAYVFFGIKIHELAASLSWARRGGLRPILSRAFFLEACSLGTSGMAGKDLSMSHKPCVFSSKTFRAAFGVALVFAAALFTGCPTDGGDGDGGGWVDDHILNNALIGTWTYTYEGGYDTYEITRTQITHKMSYTDEGTEYPSTETHNRSYVINFNPHKTAGGIIVEKTSGKYAIIWFKDLEPQKQVLIGDGYNEDYSDCAVDTIDEAIAKFTPENASKYLGGSAQKGSPQQWVNP
ncbi:MAG: hypothetical protein LBD37_07315 [Treponema sp.]|nr:hypothetical protein [Treponema sp.]